MKLELPLALAPLKQFFVKHHAVLFISLIALLLALAIYLLYMTATTKPAESPSSTIGQFDQATINKIKELHDSSDFENTLEFPKERSNPFNE